MGKQLSQGWTHQKVCIAYLILQEELSSQTLESSSHIYSDRSRGIRRFRRLQASYVQISTSSRNSLKLPVLSKLNHATFCKLVDHQRNTDLTEDRRIQGNCSVSMHSCTRPPLQEPKFVSPVIRVSFVCRWVGFPDR